MRIDMDSSMHMVTLNPALRNMVRPVFHMFAVLVALLGATPGFAQEFGRVEDTQAQAPGYFFYARPGEAVVAVTAVGSVGQAGRYLLGDGATVADLIALSGGAQDQQRVAVSDDANVRLYRGGDVIYDVPLRRVYAGDQAPPVLEENDIVEVVGLVSSARGFFVHTRPGEETIIVTAAGAFQSPGRYVLEGDARVGDLVALAGGLGEAVRRSDERIRATVRVYRSGSILLESDLSELYSQDTPILESGDVVDLESVRTAVFTWRDVVSIATGLGALALAIDRLAGL